MAFPLYVPRLNNNDDTVRLNAFLVEVGAKLRKGDPVADIETDKATFTVEAEEDGYILHLEGVPGNTLNVGATLAWMGAEVTDAPPESDTSASAKDRKSFAEPTLKALILLGKLGLSADQVPASGARLSVQDVENYAKRNGLRTNAQPTLARKSEPVPNVGGEPRELTAEERGMLRTVEWQRDHAVPGYVELSYDAAAWNDYAADFQQRHKLLMSPLLALQAWRLTQAARRTPKLNSTLIEGRRYEYAAVNLGFTVQSGEFLFIVVVQGADSLDEKQFSDRLNELQRAAMKHSLKPSESSGNTITFTSMARWKVARHMPVLPPQTSLVVAHSAPANGLASIGATYDHRVLSGFDAVQALQATVQIEKEF